MKQIWAIVLLLSATLTAAQAPALGSVSEFEVNGLKVLLKQRPGIQTVAGGIFIRGGSANLSPAEAGLEDLMLRVSEEASMRFSRSSLRGELARTGSTIGSGSGYDYSVLSFTSTRANFDVTWDIFSDLVVHPALQAADVELVKKRLTIAAQDRMDSPEAALQASTTDTIYSGQAYAVNPDGTTTTLARFTAADVRAYHHRIMQTSQLLLVLVGDLDLFSVKQKVTSAFGTLPRGNYNPSRLPPLKFNAPRVTVLSRGLPTNYVQGVYAGPLFDSPDSAALDIASHILNDRVYEEVRLKRSLSYAPSAFVNRQKLVTGGIYVTTNDINQAVSIMLKEITRLKKEPVSADILSAAVASFGTGYFLENETNAAQAAALARFELIGGGWRNAERTLERLRQVTPADVQRVAQQYMHDLQFSVIGRENSFDKAVLTTQP